MTAGEHFLAVILDFRPITSKREATPWFDSDLPHLQHFKMIACSKSKRTKKSSDCAKFKQLRNHFRNLSRKLIIKIFINDLGDIITTNPKRF